MFSYNPTSTMSERRRSLYDNESPRPRTRTHDGQRYRSRSIRANRTANTGRSGTAATTTDLIVKRSAANTSGPRGLWPQDAGCQESMGTIADARKSICARPTPASRASRRSLRLAVIALARKTRRFRRTSRAADFAAALVGILLGKELRGATERAEHMSADGPLRIACRKRSSLPPAANA